MYQLDKPMNREMVVRRKSIIVKAYEVKGSSKIAEVTEKMYVKNTEEILKVCDECRKENMKGEDFE